MTLLVSRTNTFLASTLDGIQPRIPQVDVAEVVVQALLLPEASDRAFDLIRGPDEAPRFTATREFSTLFKQTSPGLL